jgi:hypothetical protein
MTVIFTRQSETWSKHSSFPSNTATVSYTVYNEPAEAITTDEAIAAASGALLIGGQLTATGLAPANRPLFCKDVTWSQTTPTLVTATAKYDSTLFIPSGFDEDTVQSVDDTVAGYVNTALNATTYGVSWWRYQNPSAWVGTLEASYPRAAVDRLANLRDQADGSEGRVALATGTP